MPRHLSEPDVFHQELEGYPITVAQRMEQWQDTEMLHQLNRRDPLVEPPGHLEHIRQRPYTSDPGLLVAADRLRILYEAGMPVLSNSRLLFGERLLPSEVEEWDSVVQPNQAVLLTDRWYNLVRPAFALPMSPHDAEDANPTPGDFNRFLADLAVKLLQVTAQGSIVVFVQTGSDLLPPWENLANCSQMAVLMSGDGREAYALGQFIVDQMVVIDPENLFPGVPDPSKTHDLPIELPVYYHRPTRERMDAALRLISLFDQQDRFQSGWTSGDYCPAPLALGYGSSTVVVPDEVRRRLPKENPWPRPRAFPLDWGARSSCLRRRSTPRTSGLAAAMDPPP